MYTSRVDPRSAPRTPTTKRVQRLLAPPDDILQSGVALYGSFVGTESTLGDRNQTVVFSGPGASILSGVFDERGAGAAGRKSKAAGGTVHAYHVVQAAHGATLNGFRVVGGVANGAGLDGLGGGLVALDGAAMKVQHCLFSANSARHGGALAAFVYASPHLENVEFDSNVATGDAFSGGAGGAVHLADGSNATVTECIFRNNRAGRRGGALYADYGASPRVDGSRFEENYSGGNGGALYANDRASQIGKTKMVVTRSTFVANEAAVRGGAAMVYNGAQGTFTACVFAANAAGDKGGAVSNALRVYTDHERLHTCVARHRPCRHPRAASLQRARTGGVARASY